MAYVVVDVGGTRLRTAVAGEGARLGGRIDEPTVHERGPEGVVDQIVAMAAESIRRAGLTWDDVTRAAVASPGPLDASAGIVYAPPNMRGWGDVPLRAMLESRWGVPVSLVNDANAGALGEQRYGAGRGYSHMVYITVSTGIGGGVVTDGALLEGASGSGGEVGHMTIDLHGPVCKCGNIGCLEVLASGTAIARRFDEAIAAGAQSNVPIGAGGATAVQVAAGAQAGDPLASRVFREAAEALGFGVVNAIHLFNPEVVVLGGGVTRAGELLFGPVREVVERRAMPVPRRAARVVPAELGNDVGLVGAAVLLQE